MKTLIALGALALSALPAFAIDSCTSGAAVITPDGNSATVLGLEGGLCQVQSPGGKLDLISPDLLMADFGMVDTGPVAAAAPVDGLITGYYICGEAATGFEVELAEGGEYLQDGDVEGHYTEDGHEVRFKGGPLDGRKLAVQDGFLAVPGSGDPVACELLEE